MASMNLLEALRYLAALDQHRHFGRAAQACHITQPALSNALRALEAELGVALVRRSRQYEGLTTEGEVVLAHAHRLLHGSETLRQELASLAGAPRGQLKIGAVPSAVPVAARFAARLRQRHPGVQPVLRSLSSQELETGLDNLALDLGLGFIDRPEVQTHRLSVLPQYREGYFLLRAMPAGAAKPAALSFGPAMSWAQAARLPLVLLTPEMHNRVIVDRALREAGASVSPAMETNSVLALLLAVRGGEESAEGSGDEPLAAILPGALVSAARSHAGLQACALTDPVMRTPIGWLTSGHTPPSRTLAAALALAADEGWQAELPGLAGDLSGL